MGVNRRIVQVKDQALLTGAGFSCNVGGLSGRQFLIRLSNHPKIQETGRVQTLLSAENADYESIYRTVVEDSWLDEESRETVIAAYDDVYRELDRAVCFEFRNPYTHPLQLNCLATFLDWFAGPSKERGHIFTLNQDLFIERGYLGNSNIGVPGINYWRIRNWVPIMDWERLSHGELPIEVIPDKEGVQSFRERDDLGRHVPQALQYIKLHGSMNWRMREGSRVMVIAGRKLEQIRSVPLLNWYFEKFQQVLNTPEMHLCVVGYGFGDPHINQELAKAVSNNTLKRISIIHPRWQRSDLERQIGEGHVGTGGDPDAAESIVEATRRGQLFDFDLREACSTNGPISSTDAGARLLKTFGPR